MKIAFLTISVLLLGAYYIFFSDPEKIEEIQSAQETQYESIKSIIQRAKTSPPVYTSASLDELINQSFPVTDPSWAWDKVDMSLLERKHPNNLYWDMAAPTSDELVLEQRKDTEIYWQKEYGKVLSGTASKLEVDSYYSYQKKLITDYLTITQDLMNNYSNDLPEQDIRLLNLAKNMQLSKLNDIPSHWKESLDKSARHEEERQQWLADKKTYETKIAQQAMQASKVYVKQSYE